jgi:hypothetical protein
LIVFNGSTVGSIWAAGISYSGFPSWTTTAASNAGLVVSTQLVATGDAPLTYTFVSGTLPPNCTISSSGLLSGTVTGVSTNVIYTFTVAVTDAQNQNVSQSIVYTLVVSDFYYRYTSLHISSDSNPTWITDASTSALAVTTAGAPQSTTFSPLKAGYYANRFDGVPNTNINLPANPGYNLGSGQYFIQAFCYPASGHADVAGNSSHTVISQGDNANNLLWALSIIPANGTILWGLSGATVNTSSSYPVLFNAWNHIVISRDASNVERIFLNGKLINQRSNTTNYNGVSTYATRIGSWYDTNYPTAYSISAYGNVFSGYLSNVQIVVSNIPAYFQTASVTLGTNIFASPTAPVTAVTGTVLLTCQSNRFIDNSTTAATIATSGNPKIVSSNPFNLPAGLATYGSGYFNGTTDYLTTPSIANLAMATGDFTVEFWYYPQSADKGIFQISTTSGGFFAGNTNTIALFIGSINNLGVYASGTTTYGGNNKLLYNVWTHIALVRISGVTKVYMNGILDTSFNSGGLADTTNYTGTYAVIGGYYSTSYLSNGYISNFRVVKGTAVYTANFTPPTTPLTAVTNTSLLTLQTNVPHNNSQFRDTSTNNAVVTRVGNVTQGSFSPFTKQYPYSTATVGGSAYFDGTGDYLTLPSTSTFTVPASGSFTIECWVNLSSLGADRIIFSSGVGNGLNDLYFGISSSNTIDLIAPSTSGATGYYAYGTTALAASIWYHIAATRVGGTVRIFLNGKQETITQYQSGNSANQFGTTGLGYVGSYFGSSSFFVGYVSNLRFVSGTALYTSNFTPSTAPLTAVSGTVLLMPFTDAAVYDNTMLSNLETVGNVQANTSTFKYGTGALKFNGTTDYLTIPNNSNFSFGTGDFTIEMWVYASSFSGYRTLIDARGSDSTVSYGLFLETTSGQLYWYDGSAAQTSSSGPPLNTWTHIAAVRTLGVLKMFVAGVQVYSAANTNAQNPTGPLLIGKNIGSSAYFNGYIDELRITKGYARYTTAFTPASGSFSPSATFGTSVLPSKSLRFRASASAYLSKTPAVAGNQKTWTWSAWVKRGTLGVQNPLFFAGPNAPIDYVLLTFTASNGLGISQNNAGISVGYITSSALFRDPAAWYHIVAVWNSTSATATLTGTPSDRLQLWVNGVQLNSFSASVALPQNTNSFINSNVVHYHGLYPEVPTRFDGEMAEVNFVDGLALDPTMFGAYSAYNQWLPVSYSGYMGANGFYLPFNATPITTYAGSFNGSTQYLAFPNNAAFSFNSSNFTIESWINVTSTSNYNIYVNSDTSNNLGVTLYAGGGTIHAFVTAPVGGNIVYDLQGPASSVVNNAWTHVAFVRSGTTFTVYVNGVAGTPSTNSNAMPSSQARCFIGTSYNSSAVFFSGYISNLRVVNGTAVYTANFVPSVAPFTAITNTSLLTLQSATVVDNSTNAFTITNTGTVVTSVQTPWSAIATLAADTSGNANNWKPNNISLTAGPTYDSLTDVPTLTSATAANYAVLLQIASSMLGQSTITDGNLNYLSPNPSSNYGVSGVRASIPFASGKFYWEALITLTPGANGGYYIGVTDSAASLNTGGGFTNGYFWGYNVLTGVVQVNGSIVATVATSTLNDIIGLAYDRTAGTMSVYKNNTLLSTQTGTPSGAGGMWVPSMSIDQGYNDGRQIGFNYTFGQRPFTYTPPANFLALNTYNI